MTTIAAPAVPLPTLPITMPVPALVQPTEEFGRPKQEQFHARLPQSERSEHDLRRTPNPNISARGRPHLEGESSDRSERRGPRVVPFPGNASADRSDAPDLTFPNAGFMAQILAQGSERGSCTNAFERGIAAYEATTAQTDVFIGANPPVEIHTLSLIHI